MANERVDLRRGPLDMLILKTLSLEPMHGLGISRRIRQITGGVLEPKPGSLFPALQRLQQRGLVQAEWGESENNRRAKYYHLTATGRSQLTVERENWTFVISAIREVLEA
jgi:PadR family transcriptional regulator PadR